MEPYRVHAFINGKDFTSFKLVKLKSLIAAASLLNYKQLSIVRQRFPWEEYVTMDIRTG